MIATGVFGYGAVSVLYALLAILLIITWRGHQTGAYLILVSLVSAIWGLCLAIQTLSGSLDPFLIASIEIIRSAAWVVFLVSLVSQIGVSRVLMGLCIFLCVAVVLGIGFLFIGGPADAEEVINFGVVVIPGGLLIALAGLVLIEQLYRNSSAASRWTLRYLVLGVGGIFAYDLFLYSQGVLLNAIDMVTWTARGAVNLIFVPMIAIAARRNIDWEVRIFVSRQVVFYSTTLMAVGLYLLLMSVGGYVIVLYGGSWGSAARIVFFAGAVIVLLTLLFSNTLRARLKVFLSKHFFHNKYDYREEWLRLIATLADLDIGTSQGDVAVRAIAQIFESPAGVMWVREDESSMFRLAARYETADEFSDISQTDPIVQFVKQNGWVIDLAEYARSPARYGELQLPKWLKDHHRAWLLVPLQASGDLLGLILLYKAPGPPRLNYEDRDLMKTVGNHIAVHLAQARSDSLLAEAQQFETYNRLTAFLMHDLKNLIAQQSLVVANADKHKRNPEFIDDAIQTIAGSVKRMKRITGQLTAGVSEPSAKLTQLKFIVSAAVDRCAAAQPAPSLDFNGVDAVVAANAEEFTMVLTHLIGNAQDATGHNGRVAITLEASQGSVVVMIVDNGAGMTHEFVRERLFRHLTRQRAAKGWESVLTKPRIREKDGR